jgi:hypothetical protein
MPSPVTHALGLTLGLMAPTLADASVELLEDKWPVTATGKVRKYLLRDTFGASRP